jgi:two-component sensor histidine kinase
MNEDGSARYGAADLLDSPPEKAFDRISELVAKLLHVPVSLVTILDAQRQFFKSARGLSSPWSEARETPLTHSLCQHVARTGLPLVVNEARTHPLVCDNLAISDLGVEAYLGFPVRSPDGSVIGALCAIDRVSRSWTGAEQGIMHDLVEILETELTLRDEIRRRREAEAARQILMREMEHRVKNSFAKVQAIVSLSLRGRHDLDDIRKSISQRIGALAKTQSLLVNTSGQAASLEAVLRNELGYYDEDGSLSLTGPTVSLCEDDAILIGMLVHELATNAAKYGAIALGGDLAIAWNEVDADHRRRLKLEWRESGCALSGPPARTGFGTSLLDALVVRQSRGSISRDWRPEGLRLIAEFGLAAPTVAVPETINEWTAATTLA